jgi:hypothetical protein
MNKNNYNINNNNKINNDNMNIVNSNNNDYYDYSLFVEIRSKPELLDN